MEQQDIKNILKEHKLRTTSTRIAVLTTLFTTKRPLSHSEMVQELNEEFLLQIRYVNVRETQDNYFPLDDCGDMLDEVSEYWTSTPLNTLQNAMLTLNQAEEVFDKGFFLNKEALAKIIDSNNLDIDDETGEKPININNKSSKNIVILDVSGSDQKYELIDQLNSGNPIISDFKKLNSTNVEETLEFEFINGGVYALDASKQKLSDSMYLFSPKEINIENQGEDIK